MTCVSVRDAMVYARWLSQETGHSYRLPGAAEWQYAERAGSPTAMLYRNRPNPPDLCRYAHVDDCFEQVSWSDGSTVDVGSLLLNGIGLHDIIGNVSEITLACFHPSSSTDAFGYLTPHGSPESPEGCVHVNPDYA